MNLPVEIRERFRRYGRRGGRERAARMTSAARRGSARRAATARWLRERFGATRFASLGLPGGALVDEGLARLAEGEVTAASLLVSLAAPRLRREGVPLGAVLTDPEERLYALLWRSSGELAHARYTAYLRQMASFADACNRLRRKRERRAS